MARSVGSMLALASTASAAILGMNYGNLNSDNSAKTADDFKAEFETVQNLEGFSGFSSARLYTMIQSGSDSDPIEAIDAAIATNTTLLLGMWASGSGFANELQALKNAIEKYGDKLAAITDGLSVGSEDLYRDSAMGIENDSGVGVGPDQLVKYIDQVREAIKGTALSDVKIGHVDTWTAFENGTNSAVIDACDFLGFDGYPYWQSTMPNDIDKSKALFDDSVNIVKSVSKGKEVWITETGYPVSGKTSGDAVPSVENAAQYWQDVGCSIFGQVNVWWYLPADAGAVPSFGILPNATSTKPLFDLTCKETSSNSTTSDNSTSTSGSDSSSTSGSGSSSTGSSSGSSTSDSSDSTPSDEGAASHMQMASFTGIAVAVMAAIFAL